MAAMASEQEGTGANVSELRAIIGSITPGRGRRTFEWHKDLP